MEELIIIQRNSRTFYLHEDGTSLTWMLEFAKVFTDAESLQSKVQELRRDNRNDVRTSSKRFCTKSY